jgi:predicted Zn-dependent protease
MKQRTVLHFLRIIALLALTACSVNPVTGERELVLVSEQQEYAIGQEQYKPAQQSQGGVYVLDPELTIYFRQVGEKLAKVSDRPDLPYEFVVLNNSVPNAWALPSGKIAVNRGLLIELEDEAQLAAVVGHEIVHAAARHSAKRMQSGMLASAGLAGAGIFLKDTDYKEVLIGGAAVAANLTMSKYGRDHELESDHFGMQYMSRAGYDPQAAIELQQTFVRLSQGQKSDWLSGLFASHPPSQERVEENRKTAQGLGGTYRGKEAYQKAIKRLLKTKDAYAAHDEGRALLAKGNATQAQSLADKAISIEKDEALFYALRGEAKQKLGKEADALKDFDKAVALNPEYFANHLNRGLAQQAKGNLAAAEADLKKANALLPTSYGYMALGNLAEQRKDTNAAIGYYQTAASAAGNTGQSARQQLARLDMPKQPDKYLQIQLLRDGKNRVYASLENTSPFDLKSATVEIFTTDTGGKVIDRESIRMGAVKAGQKVQPAFSELATVSAGRSDRKLAWRLADYQLAK